MTGSLQTKHGRYYVVVRLPDGTGGTRTKWINTNIPTDGNNKRKAQQHKIEILAELEDTKDLVPSDILFADWLEEWMKLKCETLRGNSIECYRYYIDKHIKPYFNSKQLTVGKITTQDIQAYYKTKLSDDLSANTLHKHHVIISGSLKYAKRMKMIRYNPAEDIILPRKERFEGKAYTVEEATKLLSVLDNEPLKPAILLGLMYGLRRSEVCGLRWKDIDFEKGTMSICNTVVRQKTIIEHEQTKSAKSKRTLVLIEDTISYLKSLKAEQEKCKAQYCSYGPDPQGHVCVNRKGKPYSPDYISQGFNRLLKRHKLPPIRFHELRHTAGSLLFNNGVPIQQVSEYLGHEKISTTLDIYVHIDTAGKKATAEAMGNIFRTA